MLGEARRGFPGAAGSEHSLPLTRALPRSPYLPLAVERFPELSFSRVSEAERDNRTLGPADMQVDQQAGGHTTLGEWSGLGSGRYSALGSLLQGTQRKE